MTTPVNAWTAIASTAIDPDSPVDSALITALRNNQLRIREMLCGSYLAGESIDHNHDGINSALVPIGPNFLRNGSFESGTSAWTVTTYTGGTVTVQAAGNMNGSNCVALTSTVLANGGGNVQSNEFVPITGGNVYSLFGAIKASTANVSSKIEIIWFDNAYSQISASTVYSSSNTPTTLSDVGNPISAPVSARFMRVKLTGGVPSIGSATGVIYFDGLRLAFADKLMTWDIPGNYNFTMPTDRVYICVQGAGGSGNSGGYSGNSGGYGEGWVYAPKGTIVSISVAAGLALNAGGNAGTTYFGSYLVVTGAGVDQSTTTPAIAGPGAPFNILMQGSTGLTLYRDGYSAWLNNTNGIYNTAGKSSDGIYGGGGAATGASSGTGKGGDGFVSVKW